ncbi:conjugal transfer protein TraY, partial [Escherichia coli]|nr:conjugal transfer protein TraY [Escherichia coli]
MFDRPFLCNHDFIGQETEVN